MDRAIECQTNFKPTLTLDLVARDLTNSKSDDNWMGNTNSQPNVGFLLQYLNKKYCSSCADKNHNIVSKVIIST